MKGLALTIAVCVAFALAGCGSGDSTTEATGSPDANANAKADVKASKPIKRPTVSIEAPVSPPPEIEPPESPPTELVIEDLEEGSGPPVEVDDEVTVNYQGFDMSGKVLYSSWRNGSPFAFYLGEDLYGQGFEEGIEGMKVGGRRELSVPKDLSASEIPVIYVVDLLGR